MSKVVTEKEIITKVLKMYKNSPCLWDTSNRFYFNKQIRNECFENMLQIWHQLDPTATALYLKKKLEHFRAAYRRERKKVENSVVGGASPDSIHKPNLWYYNLLTFINDKPDTSKCSSDDENEKLYVHMPHKKKRRISQSEAAPPVTSTNTENTPDITCKDADYITSYGQTIAKQLSELDEQVRYEAERIISDVIYRARTGTLPTYSAQAVENFVIPQCGPSWYDIPVADTEQQSTCLVVTVTDAADPTIKTELEDTES